MNVFSDYCQIKGKEYMGHELSVTLSTGPLKSTNSVRNINTQKAIW